MTKNELRKLAKDKTVKYCYIYKHGDYYRTNASGYTDYRTKAGVFEKDVAICHAETCNELRLIPINIIEHNNDIIKEVEKLLSNYIK